MHHLQNLEKHDINIFAPTIIAKYCIQWVTWPWPMTNVWWGAVPPIFCNNSRHFFVVCFLVYWTAVDVPDWCWGSHMFCDGWGLCTVGHCGRWGGCTAEHQWGQMTSYSRQDSARRSTHRGEGGVQIGATLYGYRIPWVGRVNMAWRQMNQMNK